MTTAAQISKAFTDRYGSAPTHIVRAPGRVNLIGEHTDYNEGFVMPMAIQHSVWIALRPRSDKILTFYSLDFEDEKKFSLDSLQHGESMQRGSWIEYVKGVAWAMQYPPAKSLTGFEGVMKGDVPIGAGLSSSAAVEVAAARAFVALTQTAWDAKAMALLTQRAENEWVGMKCGIMDMLVSAAAQAGQALLIDCRSLALTSVPLPTGTAVVVMDTATRRGLVDSLYNERRAQCEAVANTLGVRSLRDAKVSDLQSDSIDAVAKRRARHVITENSRTESAAEAMRAGDAAQLGRLMNQSHDSLRDDFEVTNDALNTMVGLARREESCYGARMTGAGFGGCAVALVRRESAAAFIKAVSAAYQSQTALTPSLFVAEPASGAEAVAV